MLDKGFIHKSTSLAIIPFLFIIKPSGGIQICYNYRGLNTVTIKNRYPLPLICKTFDILYGAKYFTKLNVIAVFNWI